MKFSSVLVVVATVVAALFSPAQAYNDTDVLIFALNLECLEAEFYSWAAFGQGLTEEQRGGGPESVGGMAASLGNYTGIAEEIATEEILHVEFLRTALGAAAPPCPAIDIGAAFSAAANAALNTTLDPPFSPYTDYIRFLHGALLFEDVGVMAYNGAIGALQDKALARAARSIMAVEAYHAGIIRESLATVYNVTVDPYNATVGQITGAISATLDALLNVTAEQPIGPLDGPEPNLALADEDALAYAVLPSQVLNVVYLSTNATSGGFFPNGIEGALNATRGELDAPMLIPPTPATETNYTDVDILNFALNLECLEAEFYSWAAFGEGLTEEQRGGGPESVGGMKANLTYYQAEAEEIANEEIAHVELLRAALGDAAVECPAMDIGPAFAAAANAALNTTLDPSFSPYGNDVFFLHGALLFEDVGVMAYNGAIEALNNSDYRAAARSIMAVEAYHAGIVRLALSTVANVTVQPYGVPVTAIVSAISTTIDALLGVPRNQTIGPLDGNTNLVPTDANGLAYYISPRQALNVVYLAPNATMGGFYPEGVNGLIGMMGGEVGDLSNSTATPPQPTGSTTTDAVTPRSSEAGTQTAASPARALTLSAAAAAVLAAAVALVA